MPVDKEATKRQQDNAKRHLEAKLKLIDLQNELAYLRRDIEIDTASDKDHRNRLKTIMQKYSVDTACTPLLWDYVHGRKLDYTKVKPIGTYRPKHVAQLHEQIYQLDYSGYDVQSIYGHFADVGYELEIDNIYRIIQRKREEDPNRSN